ncbi:hypothetical protein C2E23DRAFT_888117 [Lenzites betulinus]|nr:hypothetical protein C2E23DRAFT_888117 [Lenzites betulinus]
MIFYDIAITFGDEVEKIWKQRFTGATVLWFLNRYLSPLGYIVIIVSFHDPSWSKATCQRYVLYPEVLKIFTATAVGVIFILRLYSIYSKSNVVLYGFGALLVLELGIKIWAFTDGTMLQLPPGLVGCILTGKSSPGDRIIYTWVAELVFDSVVFFATLYRTIQLYRRTMIGDAQSLITIIMRDGIMYFAAIFVSNLVTVLMFILATPDLKVINASFSTLITSLMVSRLMLNLRSEVLRRGPVIRSFSGGRFAASTGMGESYQLTAAADMSAKTFESSIIGNLGAPILTFEQSGHEDEYGLYEEEDDDGHAGRHASESADGEGAHPLTEFGRSNGSREDGDLSKKPSLTGSLGPMSATNVLPKLLAMRRPRTADDGRGHGDEPDHTRSLPGQLIVQVTEEVVVVDEAPPDPARPLSRPFPRLSRTLRSSPPSPRTPQSPPTPSTPRTPQSLSSPPSPHSPTSPSAQQAQALGPPSPAYPSRPPHSAGAVYPPPSPQTPDSPPARGYGARPPRSAHTSTTRRSWVAPPSWRLSLDRERRSAQGQGHGQSQSQGQSLGGAS